VTPAPPGGFWLRAGGYLIDAVLLAFFGAVVSAPLPSSLRFAATLAAQAAYFTAVPVLWRGRTIGKLAAGVTIVRVDGAPLDWAAALKRVLGYAVCGLTLGAGFLGVPFTARKRGLHDVIAGTCVIQTEPVGLARRLALIAIVLAPPLIAAYLGVRDAFAP
jgi:uncharacterized RDD family membrane protein YckC